MGRGVGVGKGGAGDFVAAGDRQGDCIRRGECMGFGGRDEGRD